MELEQHVAESKDSKAATLSQHFLAPAVDRGFYKRFVFLRLVERHCTTVTSLWHENSSETESVSLNSLICTTSCFIREDEMASSAGRGETAAPAPLSVSIQVAGTATMAESIGYSVEAQDGAAPR